MANAASRGILRLVGLLLLQTQFTSIFHSPYACLSLGECTHAYKNLRFNADSAASFTCIEVTMAGLQVSHVLGGNGTALLGPSRVLDRIDVVYL